jgi:hypothetical protein
MRPTGGVILRGPRDCNCGRNSSPSLGRVIAFRPNAFADPSSHPNMGWCGTLPLVSPEAGYSAHLCIVLLSQRVLLRSSFTRTSHVTNPILFSRKGEYALSQVITSVGRRRVGGMEFSRRVQGWRRGFCSQMSVRHKWVSPRCGGRSSPFSL